MLGALDIGLSAMSQYELFSGIGWLCAWFGFRQSEIRVAFVLRRSSLFIVFGIEARMITVVVSCYLVLGTLPNPTGPRTQIGGMYPKP